MAKEKARLREGHKMTPMQKDDQGRYFCVCSCTAMLRATTPNQLSNAVIEHIVERDSDDDD